MQLELFRYENYGEQYLNNLILLCYDEGALQKDRMIRH